MKYSIEGGNFPYVVCELESGEAMITETGAMAWMTEGIEMEASTGGGAGKMFGRMLSGESLFLNTFTASKPGFVSFATTFPGEILAIEIKPGKDLIVQKSGFLAAESGVELSMHFRKKLGVGFFGGEGFIMQRLSGSGMAFIEIDGASKEYNLAPGERLIVDTGYLAVMEDTVQIDIVQNKGIKNMLFSGEGIFNTLLTGPGKVLLQTHPISGVASRLMPYMPTKS